MQDDRDHLARLALEMELRVDYLVEESVAAAGENRKGGLSGELSLQMIVPENDVEHGTEIELVPADIVAERRSIQRNLLGLRRKLGRAEPRRAMVAILMQDESVHRAGRVARERRTDAGNLGKELVGRGWKNRDRALAGGAGVEPVRHAEHFQQEFVGKPVGSYIFVERCVGQRRRLVHGPQWRVRIEHGETKIFKIRGRVGQENDAA